VSNQQIFRKCAIFSSLIKCLCGLDSPRGP